MNEKEALKNEIIRCGQDPCYFINKYCRIQHPKRGLIPFRTFSYQEKLLSDYQKHRFNVILKARQLGISEITAAYCVWLMLFHRDKNILVMASKAETAKNIIKKVKVAIKKLPPWLILADINTDNKLSVELSNGSQIKAIATSEDAGRSEALSLLVIDEAAFVANLGELWAGLYPTVSAGGSAIVLSTPNGVGNKFHQLYVEAEKGENDFHPTKLMWWFHPERIEGLRDDPDRPGFKTSPWFEKEIRATNMSPREVAQELECATFDTQCVTPDGTKSIGEIKIGDRVLTHVGTFEAVSGVTSKRVRPEEIVKLSVPNFRKNPIYITKNHPILTAAKKNILPANIYDSIRKDGPACVDWRSIAQLDDMFSAFATKRYLSMMCPVLDANMFSGELETIDLSLSKQCFDYTEQTVSYRKNQRHGPSARFVDVDYDLGKFIGLYLAEGCGSNDRHVGMAFHSDETELHDWIDSFAARYRMKMYRYPRVQSKCTTVQITNWFLSEIVKTFVSGVNCYTKLLRWEELSKTNVEFVRGIVDGIWLGDGLHDPDKKNGLRLANEQLVRQIRTLMTMFGLITRFSWDCSDPERPNKPNSWYIELNNVNGRSIEDCTLFGLQEKRQSRVKRIRLIGPNDEDVDGWWGRISKVESYDGPVEEDGLVTVYNIEVAGSNSFVIEGGLVVHNCNFNASGETVVPGEIIERLAAGTLNPETMEHWDRGLWTWWKPEPDKKYLVTADVARGDGKDNSAAHVWDVTTMQQVAEYYGKVPVEEFATILVDLGRKYGKALLVVENTSIGLACLEHIRLAGYENLYYSRKGDHRPGEAVNSAWGPSSEELVIGFTTSSKNRPLIISKLEEYVRAGTLIIRSRRLIGELRTFVWDNGRAEAARGQNDDLVMSAAFGAWIRDTYLMPSAGNVDVSKRMLGGISVAKTDNTQVYGMSKDPRIVGKTGTKPASTPDINRRKALMAREQLRLRMRNGKQVDFRWLLQ